MRTVLVVIAVSAAVGAVLLGLFMVMRPNRVDFEDPTQWTLIKVDTVPAQDLEVKVYVYNREPGAWDSRDILQNKVIVNQARKSYVHMWRSNDDYAGGWCELITASDGSLGIVLFEREAAARVVRYSSGRFEYRPRQDEIIAKGELRYRDVDGDGSPEFIDKGGAQMWRWTPATGFTAAPRVATVSP